MYVKKQKDKRKDFKCTKEPSRFFCSPLEKINKNPVLGCSFLSLVFIQG